MFVTAAGMPGADATEPAGTGCPTHCAAPAASPGQTARSHHDRPSPADLRARAERGMSGKSIEFRCRLTYRCRDWPTWPLLTASVEGLVLDMPLAEALSVVLLVVVLACALVRP